MKYLKRIKNAKQLEKEWEKLKTEISSRSIFDDNSETAKKARKEKAENDIFYFAETYFPEYVRDEYAEFHKGWDQIRQIKNEIIIVEAFRGAGKSTFFTFLDAISTIIYSCAHYMVFGSYVVDKSALFTGCIMLELLYNPRIINDFGVLLTKQSIYKFIIDIKDKRKIQVQATSIKKDPRGLKFLSRRPDYIRLDDIQNRERASSKKFVKKAVKWILYDLFPALAEPFSFIICATAVHSKCVISTLKQPDETQEREAVKSYRYSAIVDGQAAWEVLFPLSRLDKIRRTIGTLAFNQEYLLIPDKLDEAKFKEEWIRWYDPDEITAMQFDCILAWVDPAAKNKKKNCYKAIGCAGIKSGIIYFLSAWVRRESVNSMIKAAYRIYDNDNPMHIYIEDNGGQAMLEDYILLYAKEVGYVIPYKMITTILNKEFKIEDTLSSPLENGHILFNKHDPDQKIIVDQLLQYPEGDFVDGPDMLASLVIELMKKAKSRKRRLPESYKPLEAASLLEGRLFRE